MARGRLPRLALPVGSRLRRLERTGGNEVPCAGKDGRTDEDEEEGRLLFPKAPREFYYVMACALTGSVGLPRSVAWPTKHKAQETATDRPTRVNPIAQSGSL